MPAAATRGSEAATRSDEDVSCRLLRARLSWRLAGMAECQCLPTAAHAACYSAAGSLPPALLLLTAVKGLHVHVGLHDRQGQAGSTTGPSAPCTMDTRSASSAGRCPFSGDESAAASCARLCQGCDSGCRRSAPHLVRLHHHDGFALVDLVAHVLEPGHNLACTQQPQPRQATSKRAAAASAPGVQSCSCCCSCHGRAQLAPRRPQNRLASFVAYAAARRPRRGALQADRRRLAKPTLHCTTAAAAEGRPLAHWRLPAGLAGAAVRGWRRTWSLRLRFCAPRAPSVMVEDSAGMNTSLTACGTVVCARRALTAGRAAVERESASCIVACRAQAQPGEGWQ